MGGIPKWMVYNGKSYSNDSQMDDLHTDVIRIQYATSYRSCVIPFITAGWVLSVENVPIQTSTSRLCLIL